MTVEDATLTTFIEDVENVIQIALESELECPDNGDWSEYDDLKKAICIRIHGVAQTFLDNVGKKKKGPNAYSKWIKLSSLVRAEEKDGDELITVTNNFTATAVSSAKKYKQIMKSIPYGLEISIKDLLQSIKNLLPNEKDVTISAIGWGLISTSRREEIVG